MLNKEHLILDESVYEPKRLAEYRAKIKFYPKHPDKYGYTDTFQCSGCRNFVFTSYPLYKKCEFKFCPYCGGSVE